MKKIYLIISLMLLSIGAWAQVYTTHSFGYVGGQSTTPAAGNQQSLNFTFSGGNVFYANQFDTLLQDRVMAIIGSPAMVSYFPRVFDPEFFVSKGYFSEYVQLQWSIVGQQDRIRRFRIYRKQLGAQADSTLIATTTADEYTFRDEYAEKGVLYEYTLFAEGIADELRIPNINIIQGVGFAFPFGTASGRITYEGGTAVAGVQVLAETDGNLGGKSLLLNGTDAYLAVDHNPNHTELELKDGFSIQLWTKYLGTGKGTLFSKGANYLLTYEPGTLSFTVGDATLNMAYDHPTEEFFHVTAVYDPATGLRLDVQQDDFTSATLSGSNPGALGTNVDDIYFGRNSSSQDYYHGYIDEIRIWKKPLTAAESKANFTRYLSGSEAGLSAYWKLNSGVGNGFYDFSRIGFDFNENHGVVWRGEWSPVIPKKNQLAYRGVTDANGNYVIRGFPYETTGSQYIFTPLLGTHQFEPNQQLRFVGDGSSIFNEMNFKDVSSFPVSGNIFYSNTPFPVEGIRILVDERIATGADGVPVTTDADGKFTVDVPIGFHSLRVVAANHVFENNGQFPLPTAQNKTPTYDFQEPLSGLLFQDSTLVRVAGRVVGGPIEAEKPLGFGLSKNNIGNATVLMRPKKLKNLTFVEADSLVSISEDHFGNDTKFNIRDITIEPNPVSGEFVAFLPPEEYVVTSITTRNYTFDETYHVGVNLVNSLFSEETILRIDTLLVKVGENEIFVNPKNVALFDTVFNATRLDTLFTIAVDTFRADHVQNFILRVRPNISVTDLADADYFGDQVFTYLDENLGVEEQLSLIDPGSPNPYRLGHPAFTQRGNYRFKTALFEEYKDEALNITKVPVVDGEVRIINQFAINKDEVILPLNRKGEATYSFIAGLPNIALDPLDASKSFTQSMSVTGFSGNDGAIQTVWRESDPFRGIVIGGLPTGNNFVTTGPNEIITILRDPPGSQSSTYIETGSTFSKATTMRAGFTANSTTKLDLKVGVEASRLDLISGVINSASSKVDVNAGLSVDVGFATQNSMVETTTFNRTITTSDSPGLVGADGDVFVGYSTNIVYGKSRNLQLLPDADCFGPECISTGVPGYKLGLEDGIRINPEFETFFLLSQFTIENITVPGIKAIRDDILRYSTRPDTINPINDPVYVSLIPPTDPRFGSLNTDEKVWGADAKSVLGEGPSYVIVLPQSFLDEGKKIRDTIVFYSQQIKDWEFWLAHNERVKLESKTKRNVTFDGNVTLEESEETSIQEETTREYSFVLDASVGFGTSTDLNLFGSAFDLSISQSFSFKTDLQQTETASSENSTKYGFTLNDGDLGDTYTVDIKNALDGFGPVFSTRGGATSCPYEGEVVTKYFKPGTVMNAATAQREVPSIGVDANVVAGVPDNRAAVFNLQLTNNSETDEAFEMVLDLVDGTNPFGAIIAIDGAPLGNGLVFNVPFGKSLTKTLTLRQGRPDVTDYENIKIQLRSLCQSNPGDNLADIKDEVELSAYFVPGCSDVALALPTDKWVLNSRAAVKNNLGVKITGYDLNFNNFQRIDFQYRPANSSQWLTDMKFYNTKNPDVDFEGEDDPKMEIEGTEINYNFDMRALPDRLYQIRAVSRCVLAEGVEVSTPSEILGGIKDTKRPVVFGAPQPADGVLSANDEIMIQFDETIEAGLLSSADISVQGVLNSAEIRNGTSVDFDGIEDYVRINDGLSLTNRSFTIEFWLKREDFTREQVVYSKGFEANNVFEIGFTADNKLFVNVGGERRTSVPTYTDLDWNHYAIVYDKSNNQLSGYMNDQYIFSQEDVVGSFTGEGSIVLGKSLITNDRHLNGNIHEFRIWNKVRSLGDVFARMSETLKGSEVGLMGYWPMNEAMGNKAFDLARFRHAILFADWEVSPKGKAFAFDGVDDRLELNTGSTIVITDEMDYTIEFWFKGAPDQTNAVLFSNGRGDGSDVFNDPANSVSIGFDGNGKLYYANNGEKLTVESGSYLDNNWHHFAFSLIRQSNARIFVDGVQSATLASLNLGGLSSAKMWLGTRAYQENEVDFTFDYPFNGLIDELRVWNLAKKIDQVNLNINSRLVGDEMGLVGYYPFEFYDTEVGVRILRGSMADQWLNPFGNNGGSAATFGGADLSDDTPNIKDARPVTKIDFSWAINDDKIIITPSSTFKVAMEQTVLEITVRNIEDLNENRLASPVTWNAFVDRNQVKWGTDQIQLEKPLYEPFTFKVDMINSGGTETNFSIDNLPQWLRASPASGVLSPLSTKVVTFTIDEGLNTGSYLEDIYLSSDFGFDEKLSIDLRVFSPEPNWVINPANFQYSMNVIGQLKIEDIISTDINDRVAAFVDGEIRGVVNVIYLETLDLHAVFLDIYSNVESGETIELRVWDSSKGVEYRYASPSITFATNTLLGTQANPVMIEAGNVVVQELELAKGWNWKSFNVSSPILSDINSLMSKIGAKTNDQIKGRDKFDIYTDGFGWSGTLSSGGGIKSGELYLFKMSNNGNLEIIGDQVDPSTSIVINEGWNWLGFIPKFNMSVNEAFAFFNPTEGDIIKSQASFSVYVRNVGWVGSLRNLQPGQGYLYSSATSGSFRYPEASGLTNSRLEADIITDFKSLDRFKYPSNMSMIAEIPESLGQDYVVIATAGDEIRGIMQPISVMGNTTRYFLTIHGDDRPEELNFKAVNIYTKQEIGFDQSLSFVKNEVLGTLETPYQLTSESIATEAELSKISIFPNPFENQITVLIPECDENIQELYLTDISGRKIGDFKLRKTSNGWEARLLDEKLQMNPGIYLVIVQFPDMMQSFKVIKK